MQESLGLPAKIAPGDILEMNYEGIESEETTAAPVVVAGHNLPDRVISLLSGRPDLIFFTDEILHVAKRIASKVNGDVHAFHAYDPRIAVATATANAYIPVSLPFDEIEQQMHEDHEKRFSEVTSFHDVPQENAHLVAGLTHEELPALATSLEADLVVMGAVARNRWKRLFIGATAERTLEYLPCDLLIVKPDWFKTPVELTVTEAA